MKNKQHWLEETCIGEIINNAADGWGRIFLGEKSPSNDADLHPKKDKKDKKKIIKSLEAGKVKKT